MDLLARVTSVRLCMISVLLHQLSTGQSAVQLGVQQDDKVVSELFESMGRVYIDEFRIDTGMNTTLDVRIENTPGIDEYWLLDFQPYQYEDYNPPIDEASAALFASRTGQCSSVEEDETWEDNYFRDDFFQNHSAIGTKLLFTDYTRGSIVNGRRIDRISFEGDMNTFLTCERIDSTSIWESSTYEEEIEYNTVMYATNIRPQLNWQPDSSHHAVGYVQSNINLIWRLSRTAIVKAIITSKEIPFVDLQAMFDYGIVEPVLQDDGLSPVMDKTRLYMGFSTYVPVTESGMLTYILNSVTYEPLLPENALLQVVVQPTDVLTSTPLCNTLRDENQCIQSWDYEMILMLDITQLTTERPLDATGIFGFDFNLYDCPDLSTHDGCTLNADLTEPFNVRIDLTLQSTVSALDEAGDGISVEVASVKNDAGEDIRGGVVNNGENVTVEVIFYPAFLRDEYMLDLHLFMFCKGAEYEQDSQGCLSAPDEDRFTSFVSPDLSFEYDASEDPNYVLVPSTPVPPEVDLWCGEGWLKLSDSCYWIDHGARVSYAQASVNCLGKDALLAKITSDNEQSYLAEQLIHFKDGGYYIGLNDIETEDLFVWADGSPFDPSLFEAWDGGEPNNAGNEDCIALRPDRGGDWNDFQCSQKELAYICEKPADRWSEYTIWTSCSVTCGSGSRSRSRECESRNQVDCPGLSTQTERCTMRSCDTFPTSAGQVLLYESSDYDMPYSDIASYCESRGGRPANIHSRGFRNHLYRQYGSLKYEKLVPMIGKAATQSSLFYSGYANVAIDGDLSTAYEDNSCSHTAYGEFLEPGEESTGWWMVDLEEEYCVSKVVIVNRGDCCEERLVNTYVLIGNDEDRENAQCGSPISSEQAQPGARVELVCAQPICGRYISVHAARSGTGILTLCEVMAYGHHSKYSLTNSCLEESTLGWPSNGESVDEMTFVNETAMAYVFTNQAVTCDGQITEWSFTVAVTNGTKDGDLSGQVALVVWRPSVDDLDHEYEIVGFDLVTSYVGSNRFSGVEIGVRTGDFLGMVWQDTPIAYEDKGVASFNLWLEYDGQITSVVSMGQVHEMDMRNIDAREFSFSADVEPYPEAVPYYWVDGYEVSSCSLSGNASSCPVLSDCGEEVPLELPCDQSHRAICEYDHVPVFHAVGGNGENVLDVWESPEFHEAYSRVDAGQHYKSALVEDWDRQIIGVQEVKLVLQKHGEDVLTLTFDGTATDKHNWFANDRLIGSPYNEIQEYNQFSVRGSHDYGNPYRHFYINERDGGCSNDVGWLVVLELQPYDFNGCAYELAVPPSKPAFLYSSGSGATNWQEASVADNFLIYLKYKETVISEPSQFDLAFRGIAGSGQSIWDLWDSSSYSDNGGRITYWQHYKSELVEKWNRYLITVEEVKVQLRRDGDLVLQLSFYGQGTNKYDWFSQSKLKESTFTGLDANLNYFSAAGHTGIHRRFFISEYYNGCPNDSGWFVVLDHGNYHPCQWENEYGTVFPKFLYSTSGASTNWYSGAVGTADEFLIFIKYTDNPVTPPPPTFPPPIEYTQDNVPIANEARPLDVMEYDNERNLHHTVFQNRPLADERVTVTVTSVYMLVPKEEARRKRDIRHRRSLMTSITIPQMKSTSFGSNGCPPHSRFNPIDCTCDCLQGYTYNTKELTCDDLNAPDLIIELNADVKNSTKNVEVVTLEEWDFDSTDSAASVQMKSDCWVIFSLCLILFLTL